jgi:uncharacterized membrane protein YheB (UPF0754 family)
MTLQNFIIFPVVAALIGWVTNYIAIKMLFRPRNKINFLGITIWGLVPKRQLQIADSIAETIEKELLSHQDIANALKDPEIEQKINQKLLVSIDGFISDFVSSNPMLGMFLQGEMIENIKSMLLSKLNQSLSGLLESLANSLQEKMDIKKIIRDRIAGFDLSKLEEIIYRICAKELKAIEILGAVLGFIVGVMQVIYIAAFN